MGWLSRVLWTVGVGSACLARADAVDPFQASEVISEQGIARVADEVGDGALLAHLEEPIQRERVLIAARAAPYARAPERLVPALVTLARGRDPALAPEAAQALLAISERLTPSELAARETLLSDLHKAREALAAEVEPPEPRADIAFAMAQAKAAFVALEASLGAPSKE